MSNEQPLQALRDRIDDLEKQLGEERDSREALISTRTAENTKYLGERNEALWAQIGDLEKQLKAARADVESYKCSNAVQSEALGRRDSEITDLKKDIEQLQCQLAGCSAAALGYGDDCKQGDYGWSASFADCDRMYKRYERFFRFAQRIAAWPESGSTVVNAWRKRAARLLEIHPQDSCERSAREAHDRKLRGLEPIQQPEPQITPPPANLYEMVDAVERLAKFTLDQIENRIQSNVGMRAQLEADRPIFNKATYEVLREAEESDDE